MLMCLLLPWNIGFFVNAIADLLSHKIFVEPFYSYFNSLSILQSQTVWHATEVTIIYSTFVVDNAITCYFFDDHENAHIPR